MPTVQWTTKAQSDLEEIAYYIAVKDCRPAVAERMLDEIRAKAELYATSPEIGEARDDIVPGCRLFRHKRWVGIYRKIDGGIEVIRVIDATRDFRRVISP